MRVVFVYGYEPSGHASAARAVEAALKAEGPVETAHLNISADLHPILGPAVAMTYLQLVQKAPTLWDYLYDNKAVADIAQELRKLYGLLEGGRVLSRVQDLKPDVIVCTHAMSLMAIAAEKDRGRITVPVAAVVTDYWVHTYWARPSVDLYMVPTPGLAESLREKGVSLDKVRVTGIPVHPAFEEPLERADARAALGLAASSKVAFVSGGSKALGPLLEIISTLLGLPERLEVIVACGSNEDLYLKLQARARGEPRLRPYPRRDAAGMRGLMAAADFCVGKAGGITVAECLAQGLPLIIHNPIPGQEEKNSEYLLKNQAARRADSLEDLAKVVQRLFSAPERLMEARSRARAASRAGSARLAARAVLELVKK